MPLLDVQALVKTYAGLRALDGVSVGVEQGQFFALLGPSGCGKTTLLRTIAGFVQPDSGTVLLEGAPLLHLPPERRPVNTVFQSYALFPHLTVAENVAFGLESLRLPRAEVAARVAEAVRLVRLEGMETRRPAALSGGQQQRVALARALAPRPKALLLDEPLSALDLVLRREMQLELKRLQRELGTAFIFVTHDQTEALGLADRIAVMRAGRIEQLGSPEEVYERPVNAYVAGFVGEANLVPATRVGALWRVATGACLAAEAGVPGPEAVLVLRPERASLADPRDQPLHGAVTLTEYDGAGTTVHVAGPLGTLRVRLPPGAARPVVGEAVGIVPDPGALRAVNA